MVRYGVFIVQMRLNNRHISIYIILPFVCLALLSVDYIEDYLATAVCGKNINSSFGGADVCVRFSAIITADPFRYPACHPTGHP